MCIRDRITTGRTGHAETVEVIYNSDIISYKTLLEVFFDSHDPTLINQQGPDRGTQYRSIAFYQNQVEKKIIVDYKTLSIYNENIIKSKFSIILL